MAQISDKKVSLQISGGSLKQALDELEKQTAFSFSYSQDIGNISPINIQASLQSFDSILKELAAQARVKFNRVGRIIAVGKAPAPSSKAQNPPLGSVRGRIVDFETSQPLPGATIALDSTGKTMLSDEKGFYTFSALPEGVYSLTVSYAGYMKTSVSNIRVEGGRTIGIDVKMQTGQTLTDVVINSGTRHVKAVTHTTEKQLLTEIRTATGVLSGISSELISRTGDRNAAEVVRRIPGIIVSDNRFIVVRGMNERYNLTYLNDNIAPSTELYSKAFAYDLLPSSIIDRIIVYKSPRADLNGEFVGAAVKVYTRNAMPVKHIDIGVQLAHRPGSTMTDINSYKGGSLDWLGIDDGARQLPSFSPGYFQSNKSAGNISQADMLKQFSPTLSYLRTRSTPDMQLYFNYYDGYHLGTKARLYNLTSVTYTKETTAYDVHRQTGNTNAWYVDWDIDEQAIKGTYKMDSRQTTEIGKLNALENLTLKLNDHNSIQWKNFFINDGRKFTSINDSKANTTPKHEYQQPMKRDLILSFQQRFLYSGNLGGTHQWGRLHPQQFNWNAGYSYDNQNVPDQRISHFQSDPGITGASGEPGALSYIAMGSNNGISGLGGMIARLFVKNSESNYNGSIDYTFSFSPAVKLSAGTYQLFKVRHVGRRFFRVNRGGLSPNETFTQNGDLGWSPGYGWNDINILGFRFQNLPAIWNPVNFPEDGSGLTLYDATSPVDAYVASEQNNAFYGMGDWKTKDGHWALNGGLRVEYDRQRVSGARMLYPGYPLDLIYGSHPKTFLLPSLNLTWRPGQLWVFRGSYGRSVNRPEFRELTPYEDIDFSTNELMRGNAALLSATVDNYDVRAELYPKNAAGNEIINIGAFYKHLRNPIERMRTEVSGYDAGPYTIITYTNAYSAEVYGIEAEIKKDLSFLGGGLFRRLSIVLNGTLVKSTTRQYDINIFGGINKNITVKGRPLQGQAPYVFNGGLFYEHPGTGTKMGVTYNVNGPVIYAKSLVNPNAPSQIHGDTNFIKATRPDLLRLPLHQLDFSITQRIIRSLQMKFSLQNILDQSYRIVEDHNYNQRYDPERPYYNPNANETYYKGDNPYTWYHTGRYFLLSLTYAF